MITEKYNEGGVGMSDMISVITTKIWPFVLGLFTNVFDTILGNPLFSIPIFLSLFAGFLFFVVTKVHSWGLGGKRRRRRR
jgi:hypothetical protein